MGGLSLKKSNWLFITLMVSLVLLLSACGNSSNDANDDAESGNEAAIEDEESEQVIVTLKNNEEDNVGTAVLQEVDEGVKITLEATHLTPGLHGFHIHETGACEAPDFESAGGHFNPTDAEHGLDNPEGPHAGDLLNIEVGEDGTVKEEIIADMVTLEKGQDNSLLDEDGTSLMIHSGEDDNKSQPAGNAGDRIVCGVIIE